MMLEVLYDIPTKEVRAWNADASAQGKFKVKEGQSIALLPCEIPVLDSDIHFVDLPNQQVIGNPSYVNPGVERSQAKERAIQAILANKAQTPWGAILYDWAIAQGWR